MRNIVVVEASSTGFNFIRDIINRNFYPIALNIKGDGSEESQAYKKLVNNSLKHIDVDFELLEEKDTYDETLEMIREYDPLLVVPGSELGVRLATKLSNDLGLLSNPIENLDAMTLKNKMQEKIAEAGLRHIRGRVVKSVEEAIEFYDESGFTEVVVKPIIGAGSVGVRICLNKDEMIDSIKKMLNEVNIFGNKITEMVVQERIKGEEYFVNTVSYNGDHRVTLMWKYTKVKT